MEDLKHIVQQVRDSREWDFTTQEGVCAYAHAVRMALNAHDGNFGSLIKSPGQNHCVDPKGRTVAVDAALYKSNGQIVDFILSGGPRPKTIVEDGVEKPNPEYPGNGVSWGPGPVGEYPESSWLDPGDSIPNNDDDHGHTDPPPPPSSNLQTQIDDLKVRVKTLEGKLKNLDENILARLEWLEDGKTGPDYHGEAKISIPFLGTRTIGVYSKPVVKEK